MDTEFVACVWPPPDSADCPHTQFNWVFLQLLRSCSVYVCVCGGGGGQDWGGGVSLS